MGRVEFREERCKGCLLCTVVCPEQIIEQAQRFNPQGYKIVQLNEQRQQECKGCAFCAEICPDSVITVFRSRKENKQEKEEAVHGRE